MSGLKGLNNYCLRLLHTLASLTSTSKPCWFSTGSTGLKLHIRGWGGEGLPYERDGGAHVGKVELNP